MMMEPPPATTFEMIETEFVLELLVVPLDPPAQMSQTDEGGQRGRPGQSREVVLRRCRLARRPLAQDPLDGAGFGAVLIMRGPNSQGDKSRAHAPPCAFTPGHRRPSREGQPPDERRQAEGMLAGGALHASRRAATQAAA